MGDLAIDRQTARGCSWAPLVFLCVAALAIVWGFLRRDVFLSTKPSRPPCRDHGRRRRRLHHTPVQVQTARLDRRPARDGTCRHRHRHRGPGRRRSPAHRQDQQDAARRGRPPDAAPGTRSRRRSTTGAGSSRTRPACCWASAWRPLSPTSSGQRGCCTAPRRSGRRAWTRPGTRCLGTTMAVALTSVAGRGAVV